MKIEKDCFHCRVVMIGNTEVGKTSIMNRLILGTFNSGEGATVGANYQLYIQEVNQHKIEIQIWDTAGQEKYRSLGPIYFRNALGAIVVYDVTNRTSFDTLSEWITAFQNVAGTETVIAVIGNKSDRPDAVVDIGQAEAWAQKHGYHHFITSAKNGDGVVDAFRELAKLLLRMRADQLEAPVLPATTRGGCC